MPPYPKIEPRWLLHWLHAYLLLGDFKIKLNKSISIFRFLLSAVLIWFAVFTSQGQILPRDIAEYDTLSDGVLVMLVPEINQNQDDTLLHLEYLPTHFRLAVNKEGDTEFMLTEFSDGASSSALLHFLMTWGLTDTQMVELNQSLLPQKMVCSGPVSFIGNDHITYKLISRARDPENNETVLAEGEAGTFPGLKFAVAVRLNEYEADFLKQKEEVPWEKELLCLELEIQYRKMRWMEHHSFHSLLKHL